ncbi:hypothetical protein Hdeb2414_s0004g00123441 [Helianthus debilis subsp. tardiflorus]
MTFVGQKQGAGSTIQSPQFMAFVGQKDGNDTDELPKKASKESESLEKKCIFKPSTKEANLFKLIMWPTGETSDY